MTFEKNETFVKQCWKIKLLKIYVPSQEHMEKDVFAPNQLKFR